MVYGVAFRYSKHIIPQWETARVRTSSPSKSSFYLVCNIYIYIVISYCYVQNDHIEVVLELWC